MFKRIMTRLGGGRLRHRLRRFWDTYRHAARHRDAFETMAADRDRWQALCETTATDRNRSAERERDDDDLVLGMVVFLVWQRDETLETLARRTLEWIGDYGTGAGLPQSLPEADDLESRIPAAIIRYADVAFSVQRSARTLLPLVRFALDNADPASRSFYYTQAAALYFGWYGREEKDEEKIKEAAALERDLITRALAEGAVPYNPERAHLRGLFCQALPKSGSTFLLRTLQGSLGMHGTSPAYRWKGHNLPQDNTTLKPLLETLGLEEADHRPRPIMGQRVVPDLLSLCAREGGVMLNGHASGRPENLAVMREQGINKAVILMRDPRQAAISMYHFRLTPGKFALETIKQLETDPEAKNRLIRQAFLTAVLWNNSWLTARDAGDIRVHIVRFEDMAQDATAVVASIYDFWGLSLADYPPVFPEKTAATNFREGKTDTWKTDLDEETKAAMAEVMAKVPCGY